MFRLRNIAIFVLSIAFLYVGIAVVFGRVDLSVRAPTIAPYGHRNFYDYRGVINVQSITSSGSGSFEDIARSATLAGLDFLIITDLNDFNPPLERQTYIENVLMMVGGEYSFVDSRLLNIGFQTTEHLQGPGRSQIIFSDLLSRHDRKDEFGFFIMAHPSKSGRELPNPIPAGLDGIELFNLKSVWQSSWLNKRSSFIWALFLYPINIQWSFTRLFVAYQNPEISNWDQVNAERPFIGFAGAEADAKTRSPFGGYWKIPSYQVYFSIMRNHILIKSELTGNVEQDRQKVLDALKSGSFYMSLDLIGDTTGFESYLIDKKKKILPLGTKTKLADIESFVVDLPERPLTDFEVIIYRNGEKMLSSDSLRTELTIHTAGSYRAVVRVRVDFPFEGKKWVNWILTNPVYIR